MPAERYYSDQTFKIHSTIMLEDQEFHHLSHVMRAQQGEEIELVNGQGQLAIAVIVSLEKKRAHLSIQSVKTEQAPSFQVILAQAIPRGNRLDFILEKGTELGMSELWLFPGKLSERSELTGNQHDRIRLLTIAAMKQCGRLYLPKISWHPPLSQWKTPPYPAFFGDLSPAAPPFAPIKNADGCIFFVGPESGFSDKELQTLKDLNVKGVKLSENILRTDTAAITALALMTQNLLGPSPA